MRAVLFGGFNDAGYLLLDILPVLPLLLKDAVLLDGDGVFVKDNVIEGVGLHAGQRACGILDAVDACAEEEEGGFHFRIEYVFQCIIYGCPACVAPFVGKQGFYAGTNKIDVVVRIFSFFPELRFNVVPCFLWCFFVPAKPVIFSRLLALVQGDFVEVAGMFLFDIFNAPH